MNHKLTSSPAKLLLVVALLAGLALLGPAAQGQRQSKSTDCTAELQTSRPDLWRVGAEWWKWALGIPAAENPILDETGEFADVDQSGSVWFLAGNFGGTTEPHNHHTCRQSAVLSAGELRVLGTGRPALGQHRR